MIVLQFVSRLLGGSKVGLNGYLLPEDLCYMPRLPGLLLLEPLSLQQATVTHASSGDTQTLKGRSGSVSVGSPGAHQVCLSPLSISGGYGV